jgi:hypothetical protein
VHPEDAERARADLQAALDQGYEKPYAHEYQVLRIGPLDRNSRACIF